jgi:mono/diheme cytochrome c family protein
MRQLVLIVALAAAPNAIFGQQSEQLARGKAVYDYWCATCHAEGDRYPGTAALGVKYDGQLPAALEQRDDLVPEVVKAFVRSGVSVMPFFRKTEITDSDLDALAAYLSASEN